MNSVNSQQTKVGQLSVSKLCTYLAFLSVLVKEKTNKKNMVVFISCYSIALGTEERNKPQLKMYIAGCILCYLLSICAICDGHAYSLTDIRITATVLVALSSSPVSSTNEDQRIN